jgi:NAD binding domain of 6-phosphogluconate dehydrogenase
MTKQLQQRYEIGVVGLGVMGRNLLLNMADHEFTVAGYDKDQAKVEVLRNESKECGVRCAENVQEFARLHRRREGPQHRSSTVSPAPYSPSPGGPQAPPHCIRNRPARPPDGKRASLRKQASHSEITGATIPWPSLRLKHPTVVREAWVSRSWNSRSR